MNATIGTTSEAGVLYLPPGNSDSRPSSGYRRTGPEFLYADADGPLTVAGRTLAESLSRFGFIDLTASFQENFAMYLEFRATESDSEDLKPGALRNLMSWLRSNIAAEAEQSVRAQARVSPQAAVKLLT